ncbi:MAG: hypothetical protein GXP54_03145, partial [Deltaproteobacteria bacterium]|nr:hypothetical protein [Deltaproteobacteria bacterium]
MSDPMTKPHHGRLATIMLTGLCLWSCGSGAGNTQKQQDIPTVFKDIQPVEIDYELPVQTDNGVIKSDIHEPEIDPGQPPSDSIDSIDGDDSIEHDPGIKLDDGKCTPDCAGRECGNDGCGGKCGTCPGTSECIAFQCVCIPDCADRECGDDGCGGVCSPGCGAGVKCLDWGKCARFGPCKPSSTTLTCAES